jgi:Regulator of ribonuclease activity B
MAAGRELKTLGFRVEFGRGLKAQPESRRWPVLADRTEVINEEVIIALRGPLTRLAKRFGGEYDGWEAQVG